MPKTGAYRQPNLDLPIDQRVISLYQDVITDPDYEGADTIMVRNVDFISATPGQTTWEMEIQPHHCNKSGNLHGGAAAVILDNLTSTALLTVARPGFLDKGHVSRTITMTYLRPVPLGAKVRIECEVIAAGKTTAHIRGIIKNQKDGKVCVTCEHDKAVIAGPKL